MAPTKISKLQKPTGSIEACSSSSRKQEKFSIEKTIKKPTRKRTTKMALNPESVKKVRDLLEKELGTTIQEGKRLMLIRLGQSH